jgi:hypothetical protein
MQLVSFMRFDKLTIKQIPNNLSRQTKIKQQINKDG